MLQARLDKRQRMLSLWVQGRLGERETVKWGVSTSKQARGQSRQTTIELIEFLSQHAQTSEPAPIAKIWKLFATAARDTPDSDVVHTLYEISQKISQAKLISEDVDEWVDCLRPRLVVEDADRWTQPAKTEEIEPIRWVHWSLKTTEEIGNDRFVLVAMEQLKQVPPELLFRFLERGTSMLVDALALASEIGWIDGDHDTPNYSVHRVFTHERESGFDDESQDDAEDPDRYNDSFAPAVRALSGALDALITKDQGLAIRVARSWSERPFNLFKRLFAYAAWTRLVNEQDVAAFLVSVNDVLFWRWNSFPEIATLRATRWASLSVEQRSSIQDRLVTGPSRQVFSSEAAASTYEYFRDHEIARLVDNKLPVSQTLISIVAERRANDQTFPSFVPMLELGLPGLKVGDAPEGNPNTFDNVVGSDLLQKLYDAETFHFSRGDDADAFAQTQGGKFRIIDALENSTSSETDPKLLNRVWSLLLLNPSGATEGPEGRLAAERIARLALSIAPDALSAIADRLCYWLDAADSKIPAFDGVDELWQRLLPIAVDLANGEDRKHDNENDLTTAALNEPLGHLLSLFFRRCPTIQPNEALAELPEQFVGPLKHLVVGRAHELLANRLVIVIGYFYRMDSGWIERVVLRSMKRDDDAGRRLWEAFAKYARIPEPDVWRQLESLILRHLVLSLLSPDAKKRLSEMCVAVWIWSKRREAPFELKSEDFRLALELASDAVRGAVAWQFSVTIGSKKAKLEDDTVRSGWQALGRLFFQEVWPLEPNLQSATSANDFARIPGRVEVGDFGDAVNVVSPYLVPFEIWSVKTEFSLDPDKPKTREIVERFPKELVTLLSVTISDQQQHGIFDLRKLLDLLVEAHPDYQSDLRLRTLRKLAPNPN